MQDNSNSLFTKLGGEPAIEKILSAVDKKVLEDKTLGPYFKGIDVEKVHSHTKTFLIQLLGGPAKYEGKGLVESHKHLKLEEGHLNYFIHMFRETMLELKVDENLANQVTWKLETLRSEILDSKTLYDRLGGEHVFSKLEELLSEKILSDSLLGPIYSQTDFKRVNRLRMDYIKLLFGAKVQYTGKSMHESHASHKLNDRHFDRFIFIFEECLKSLQIGSELVKESVQELEKTRFKIVGRTSLLEQLGGLEALSRIVPKFHERILNDPHLGSFFAKVDIQKLNENRKHYFASLWGGSHSYTGQSMHNAHHSLKLDDHTFNLFLKHLYLTFMSEGIKEDLVCEAIGVLNLTRGEILGRKSILERLGGEEELTKIVEDFHENARADKVLGPIYSKADHKMLTKYYTQYLANLFGAFDINAGTSLKSTHGSLNLDDVHYDLFIQLFKQAMEVRGVDADTVDEVTNVLETKRTEVLKKQSLWTKLGGYVNMERVIHRFEEILMNDPVVGPMHKGIDVKQYHENHRDLFAELFKGYHFYSGKSLSEAHRPFKLKDEHFNLFVNLFVQSLEEFGTDKELVSEVREAFELERNEVLNRRSLYEKLGGEKSIELLVEKLNQKLANDPVVGPMFKNADWEKLQLHRKQFFTHLFGNLNVYQGKDMRSAHSSLNLTDEHFTIFEKHFKDTLGEMGFTEEPIKQALTLLETTKRDVLNTSSLYEKLGGQQGLEKFVRTLDQLSAKNPELAPFFEKVDMSKLNEHRLQYFSNMFGGHTKYEGKSMSSAHDSMPLSDKHLKIFLDLVQDTLNEIGTEPGIRDEVVMIFQTKRNEIINQ